MDNLTHTLVGAALAQSGLARKYGPGATAALVIGSNLPDIDVLWPMVDPHMGQFYHRVFTHSALGVPVLAGLAAWLLAKWFRGAKWRHLALLTALGMAGHILLDLWNAFGVALLYPWSLHRFRWEWVSSVDFIVWGCCLLPWVARWRNAVRWQGERAFRLALAALAVYVMGCGVAQAAATRLATQEVSTRSEAARWTVALPEVLGPHRFKTLTRFENHYEYTMVNLVRQRTDVKRYAVTQERHPAVQLVKASPIGRELEPFYLAPVWTVTQDGPRELVDVHDLRFDSLRVSWQKAPYAFRFIVEDGVVRPVGWDW